MAHAQIFVVDDGGGNQPTPLASIGEYNFDGTTINASLLTGLSGLHGPYVMAVSGGNIFVENSLNGTIGEYTTSGATVNASLISGFNNIWGITASGGDLFVANYDPGKVGEYTTSGTPVNASLITGLNSPYNIAVSGGDIFVGNGNSIAEYTTSGTPVNTSLISGFGAPGLLGIVVVPVPEPATLALAGLSGLSLWLFRRRLL